MKLNESYDELSDQVEALVAAVERWKRVVYDQPGYIAYREENELAEALAEFKETA